MLQYCHLSKHTLNREESDMGQYDEIAAVAIANYGIVTSAEATRMGVALKDMHEWVLNGRLEKAGRGVFRLCQYPYNEYCHYAEAVALVGEGTWICGESVLAMHNLALVNPVQIHVATTKRVRRALPRWITVVKKNFDADKDDFNGIPCQNLASVFVEFKGKLMSDRLIQAIKEAKGRGLLTIDDSLKIRKEFGI